MDRQIFDDDVRARYSRPEDDQSLIAEFRPPARMTFSIVLAVAVSASMTIGAASLVANSWRRVDLPARSLVAQHGCITGCGQP